jgi:hypothetical protein
MRVVLRDTIVEFDVDTNSFYIVNVTNNNEKQVWFSPQVTQAIEAKVQPIIEQHKAVVEQFTPPASRSWAIAKHRPIIDLVLELFDRSPEPKNSYAICNTLDYKINDRLGRELVQRLLKQAAIDRLLIQQTIGPRNYTYYKP